MYSIGCAPISAGCGTKGSLVAAGEAERPLPIAANRLYTVIRGFYDGQAPEILVA
jgi:hypothetical protein